MPGITAQAISAARRAADVGATVGDRAGDTMAERMIANWATTQHATAIQKIASANETGMKSMFG